MLGKDDHMSRAQLPQFILVFSAWIISSDYAYTTFLEKVFQMVKAFSGSVLMRSRLFFALISCKNRWYLDLWARFLITCLRSRVMVLPHKP